MKSLTRKLKAENVTIILFILFTGIGRVFINKGDMPFLANFTPLGAMALYGGAYLKKL